MASSLRCRRSLRNRFLSRFVLLVAIGFVQLHAFGQKPQRDPSEELELIASRVQDGSIKKIEILAVPKAIETITAITPARLRTYPGVSNTVIRDLDRERQSIAEALKHTTTLPFTRDSDLRRGIIFYPQDSKPLTIYYDQFDQGLVNGVKVKFSGALLNWVEKQIPPDHR